MSKINSAPARTRERIRKALASLLEEKKSLSNITITELTERANVSRSTFYTHYKNLHAVVVDFQTEIFDNFFAAIKTPHSTGNNPSQDLVFSENASEQNPNLADNSAPTIDDFFDRLADFLRANETTYRQLLSSSEALEYGLALNQTICEQCFRFLKHRGDLHRHPIYHLKIDINFFVDGLIGLLTKYFRDEIDLTLDQIIDYAKEISHFYLA